LARRRWTPPLLKISCALLRSAPVRCGGAARGSFASGSNLSGCRARLWVCGGVVWGQRTEMASWSGDVLRGAAAEIGALWAFARGSVRAYGTCGGSVICGRLGLPGCNFLPRVAQVRAVMASCFIANNFYFVSIVKQNLQGVWLPRNRVSTNSTVTSCLPNTIVSYPSW
jgi:hypothetical protein